jgi:type I restriction-modification system DNA methylase subunit
MTHQDKPIFLQTHIIHKLSEYVYIPSDNTQKIFKEWADLPPVYNETQLQADFLNQIFGDILGYSYERNEPEYNLEKEVKTDLDGQKPDGILGFFTKDTQDVRVIIELKNSLTDLDVKQYRSKDNRTPIDQAFGYVSKYPSKQTANEGSIEWVIVSNFKEIRLYRPNYQGAYHVFKLSELATDSQKQKEFHFLCAKNRLFTHTPKISPTHALNPSVKGDGIEREFYNQYKSLREQIWYDLIELNTDKHYGRNFYLYKAQKLIDRIIFIRFCRENGAIDFDIVGLAINETLLVKGKYNRLKYLFSSMDLGNFDINLSEFNGGLFAPDDDLDCLTISDAVIDKIYNLYCYNFGSDLDVNILGHIFEQSISDLEDLTGDNQKKRKKDGVFYTPAYVTEYIIVQTIDAWLSDKMADIKHDKNSDDYWTAYAEILKTIKILDPACGSGAFLVKVFDVLQKKWREIKTHITIDYEYYDILKNNIFGVDLNPSSVGITKLSLWLKTAHHRKPLTTLDNNIKIGNSLIDNPDLAGYYSEFEGMVIEEIIARDLLNIPDINKIQAEGLKQPLAFDWKEKFKSVFEAGGFDIIVGNPPYVFARGGNFTKDVKNYFYDKYKISEYQLNTYLLFIEKAYIDLLKPQGRLGFIVPNNWLTINSFARMREFILEKTNHTEIINMVGDVFEGVSVDSCILTFEKSPSNQEIILGKMINQTVEKKSYNKNFIVFGDNKIINFEPKNAQDTHIILEKINNKSKPLEQSARVLSGIMAYETGKGIPPQTDKMRLERVYHSKVKMSDHYVPYLEGSDVMRYSLGWSGEHIAYGEMLAAPRKEAKFIGERILVRQIPSKMPYAINAVLTDAHYINDRNSMIIQDIQDNPFFIVAILNSKITSFWFAVTFNKFSRTIFPQFKVGELKKFPIPQATETQKQALSDLAKKILELHKEINRISSDFLDVLKFGLKVKKMTKKIIYWYDLTVEDFLDEIKKQIPKLSKASTTEWIKNFKEDNEKISSFKAQIYALDKQIDQIVYDIYGLSDADITVIETAHTE